MAKGFDKKQLPKKSARNKQKQQPVNILSIEQALELGISHHQAGRFQQAEQLYKQVLQVQPNNPEALHFLGLLARQFGQPQTAVDLISKAVQLQPDWAQAHSNLGIVLKEQGKLEEAAQSFRQALQLDPDCVEVHNGLGSVCQQQGKFEEEVQIYRQLLKLKPESVKTYNSLGIALAKQGKFEEAAQTYRQLLKLNPDSVTARNNLGNALKEQGKLEEAAQCYRQALELEPDHLDAQSNLGIALMEQGKLEEAAQSFRKVLTLKPDYVEAHASLANVCQRQGKLEEALQCYLQALELKPDYGKALTKLGNVYQEQGKLEEAFQVYRQALELESDCAEARTNLGNIYQRQGKLEQAAQVYRQALELEPDCVVVHNNLGVVLMEQGKLEEALQCYRQALQLNPDDGEAHSNQGIALMDQGKLEEAVQSLCQARRLTPKSVNAHNNLGIALKKQGKIGEAVQCFRDALQLNPDYINAYNNLGYALMDQGKLEEALQCYRQALQLAPDYFKAHSNLLFGLGASASLEPEAMLREAQAWYDQQVADRGIKTLPHQNDRNPHRQLRIGYVSPDFMRHSVSYFIEPVIKVHDRSQVEIYCYAQVTRPDDVTRRIQAAADHWRSTVGKSDAEVAQLIQQDQIDILIDLAGHTKGNRLQVFGMKPAPVQATYLGYFATTGLPTIDYWITDRALHPEDTLEKTAEEIWRLPRCYVSYQPFKHAPAVSPPPCLSSGRVTFGSFNNLSKVTQTTVELWTRVLDAVPGSRLLIKAANLADPKEQERIQQMFAEGGISLERLLLRARTPSLQEHLAMYSEVDICLDTVPYTGCTTTCDALWMGVPVLTLAGIRKVERMSTSVLQAVGREEWIATSADEFVEKAVRLASDSDKLRQMRQQQRELIEWSPLRDPEGLARALEQAYRSMWHRFCDHSESEGKSRVWLSNQQDLRKKVQSSRGKTRFVDLRSSKVLLSHHWSFYQQRYPIFAHDEFYVTSSTSEHSKVINLPINSSYDVEALLEKLPSNWHPDLFVAKVDSFFNLVPRNVEALKCPKILILGDTHHGFNPLNKMIEYAKSEKYDFYITDHKRHHLWYYWLAGIKNLYWLPSLFLYPPDKDFQQQTFRNPKLNNSFFQGKTVFVGQAGKYHPRRRKILQDAKDNLTNFWFDQLSQRDSLKVFAAADISLNISLNGDLNLRTFEILSARGFLLADKLTDESGINLLLNEGEEYESFSNLEELAEKIHYFSKSPEILAEYRQKGHSRYLNEYSPQRMVEILSQLVQGGTIEDRFTTKSINRIQHCRDTEFSRARISLYQVIQDLHRDWENVEILLDARIKFTSAADFLDLPRVKVTLTNYDDAYVNALEPYLRQSGNHQRIRFVREVQSYQEFNAIITSICDAHLLSQLQNKQVVIVSKDYHGLESASQYTELRGIISSQEDFQGSFFVLGRKNFQPSDNLLNSPKSAPKSQDKESKLIGHLNLKDINLIIFPDWNQAKDLLTQDLANAIRAIATHPDNSQMTLLVDSRNVAQEDARLAVSSAIALLKEENVSPSHELPIVMLGKLSEMQWEALLPRIHSRIPLQKENQEAINSSGANKLPISRIDLPKSALKSQDCSSSSPLNEPSSNGNKHILLYTDDSGSGGVAQYNHSILEALIRQRYQLTSVHGKDSNPLIDLQKELGIDQVFLEFDTVKDFRRTLTNLEDARDILAKIQPDLVIFSDCCPLSNFAAKQVAIELGIPYVIVIGFVAPYLAERFATYLDALSHQYAQAKAVVAVSQENLDLLYELFKLPRDKGQVIYYGRPEQYFAPCNPLVRDRLDREARIPSDAVVCLTAARLAAVKGFQYQLKAIAQLKETSIWPKLYFVWAGEGALRAELESEIQQLGATNQVILLGQRWDIADWLDAADIFVLPSQLEGMPLAIMEAMAKGVPVIASAVSGIPEELGDTGKLLTDPKIDPEATVRELVNAIQAWAENPELRKSVGQASKQRAEKLFRESRMVQETVNVIQRALLPPEDYVSPGFSIIVPDAAFPNMVVGDKNACRWPYLRREIPQKSCKVKNMEEAEAAKAPILIIIGMHRSGTSLTASLLQSAGLHIGRNLMGPNKGNVKGHFENLDFFEFHRQVLHSQGINENGWTLQETIEVEDIYVEKARKLVVQNDPGKPWGWKDPRTTLFLEFWAGLLTDANFLLVYRSPWDVIDSLYRRGDGTFQHQPELAAKMWLHYNRKILDFYNQFLGRCLLVNIQTIVNNRQFCFEAVNEKFHLNLAVPASDIYDPSLIHTQGLDPYRPGLVNHYFPEAVELYQEMEKKAWQPKNGQPDLSWQEQIGSTPYRVWGFQDWSNIRHLERQNKILKADLEKCKSQLRQTEAKLGSRNEPPETLRRIRSRSGIPHGPEGIKAVGHRRYVGDLWDEIGWLQFDFLINNGLQPYHYLLDIACGSLRGGVHFIPYLDTGHYLGIDKESDLLRAGIEQELSPELCESKKPQFLVSNAFEFENFTVRPDYALAQSLFTHLPPPMISACFKKLRSVIQQNGVFYATFFETESPVSNPKIPHDHGHFAYTRQEMENFGTQNGWHAQYIGNWNHPRNQVIVQYRPAKNT